MRKFCFVLVFIAGCISAPTKERISSLEKQKLDLVAQIAKDEVDKTNVETQARLEELRLKLAEVSGALKEAKTQGNQERIDSGIDITDKAVNFIEPLTRGVPYLGQIMGMLVMVLGLVKKK